MPKTVAEKFSFSEPKIGKVKFFTQGPAKIFCFSVFNVGGCLASCLTFKPFLTLDSQQKKKRVTYFSCCITITTRNIATQSLDCREQKALKNKQTSSVCLSPCLSLSLFLFLTLSFWFSFSLFSLLSLGLSLFPNASNRIKKNRRFCEKKNNSLSPQLFQLIRICGKFET